MLRCYAGATVRKKFARPAREGPSRHARSWPSPAERAKSGELRFRVALGGCGGLGFRPDLADLTIPNSLPQRVHLHHRLLDDTEIGVLGWETGRIADNQPQRRPYVAQA